VNFWVSPQKPYKNFYSPRAPRLTYFVPGMITLILLVEEYKLWSSWLCIFLHPPINPVLPRYLHQHSVVKDAHTVFFSWFKRPGVTSL